MSDESHTPWDFAAGDLTVHANRLAEEICKSHGGDDVAGNFNLLEASPELLASLKELLAITPGGDGDVMGLPLRHVESLRRAREAVDKAEGRQWRT